MDDNKNNNTNMVVDNSITNLKNLDSPNQTGNILNENDDKMILYYNTDGRNSFYMCLVPTLIFIIGYIVSGGSFSEGDAGANWWIFFPLLMVAEPSAFIASTYLALRGLNGSKLTPAYITLTINFVKLIILAIAVIQGRL